MKKRTAGIMLGIMLTASLIAGCGNNKATEAASESAQTEKEGTGEAIPEDSGITDTEETSDSQKEDSKKQNKESSSTEEVSEKDTDSQDSKEAVQEDREKIAPAGTRISYADSTGATYNLWEGSVHSLILTYDRATGSFLPIQTGTFSEKDILGLLEQGKDIPLTRIGAYCDSITVKGGGKTRVITLHKATGKYDKK